MPALETLHFLSIVLSMLAFTGKYGTSCLYLSNCIYSLESFLYLKLYNTMIVIDCSICRHCNTPLLEHGIVHAGIYW